MITLLIICFTNFFFVSAQDLRVNRPWDRWPASLVMPMILMRESMKKSMIQSVSKSSLDLSISRSPKNQRLPADPTGFDCPDCGRIYKLKSSLRNHQKWECGKDPQFKCPYCVYKAKQKMHMARHMERMHKEIDYSAVKSEDNMKIEETAEGQ